MITQRNTDVTANNLSEEQKCNNQPTFDSDFVGHEQEKQKSRWNNIRKNEEDYLSATVRA